MVLSFELSGTGHELTLAEAKALATSAGYTLPNRAPSPDLDAMFQAFGCRALSPFRKKFATERLCPPADGAAAPPPRSAAQKGGAKESLEPDPPLAGVAPLPSGHFEAAAATWEKGLKWRLVMRPGGAYVSPPDWYRLYAAAQQAEAGDNPLAEAPMWAENGGIDFGARAQWDAWDGLRGWDRPRAVALFCRAYAEAHHPSRVSSNFHSAPPPNPWLASSK